MIAIKNILLVLLGSSIGGAFRYAVSMWIPPKAYAFPWGTFIVNIVGCFFIGAIIGYIQKQEVDHTELKLLLATGFCGGFTTFSAFAFENIELLKQGNTITTLTYILSSIVVGITAVWLGNLLIR